jgi:hypothetical protein
MLVMVLTAEFKEFWFMKFAVLVATLPFTVDVSTKLFVEVETVKVFIVFDALIAARELFADALKVSGPFIVVVPFKFMLFKSVMEVVATTPFTTLFISLVFVA